MEQNILRKEITYSTEVFLLGVAGSRPVNVSTCVMAKQLYESSLPAAKRQSMSTEAQWGSLHCWVWEYNMQFKTMHFIRVAIREMAPLNCHPYNLRVWDSVARE